MANFNATTGVDNVDLGNGTDSVTVTNTNQIQIGDYFQGGNGTDDIIISGASGVSVDLSGAGTTAGTSGFNDFGRLVFNNTSGTSGATLSSGQFSGSLIEPNLAIVGAAGAQADLGRKSRRFQPAARVSWGHHCGSLAPRRKTGAISLLHYPGHDPAVFTGAVCEIDTARS
jgi:hypothetical protein